MNRKPMPCQRIRDLVGLEELPGMRTTLWEEGRYQHSAFSLGTGVQTGHLLLFYGWAGARQGAQPAKERNEAGIRQIFARAAALGDLPVIVAGDFNDDAATSQALADALQSGDFHDAAQVVAAREGKEPEATHVRVGQQPSRIDQVYVTSTALAALRDVKVLQEEDFPDHRPVQVDFDWARVNQTYRVVKQPKPLPMLPTAESKEGKVAQQRADDRLMGLLHQEAAPEWARAAGLRALAAHPGGAARLV